MRINNWIIVTLFIAALIGFGDSAYLTAQHVRGVIPPCGIVRGCETVLASAYASIGPVPVAFVGLAYYAFLLVLLIAYLDTHDRRILHWFSWVVSTGFLATLYFLFVQAFVLHAFCPYCLTSAAATVILFGLSVRVMRID